MSGTALETRMLQKMQHDLEYNVKPFSPEYFALYEQLMELVDRIRTRP